MLLKKFIVYDEEYGIIKFHRTKKASNIGACSECNQGKECVLDKLPRNKRRFLCGAGLHHNYYNNSLRINNKYIYVIKKNAKV